MMKNVIEVKPDKQGKYFVTFFGTKYELKIKENKKEKSEDQNKEEQK